MKYNKKVFEIMDSTESLDEGFEDIIALSNKCKFHDCTHTTEPDCAIQKAIFEGVVAQERVDNYYRVKKEAKYVTDQKNKTKAIDYMRKKKLF